MLEFSLLDLVETFKLYHNCLRLWWNACGLRDLGWGLSTQDVGYLVTAQALVSSGFSQLRVVTSFTLFTLEFLVVVCSDWLFVLNCRCLGSLLQRFIHTELRLRPCFELLKVQLFCLIAVGLGNGLNHRRRFGSFDDWLRSVWLRFNRDLARFRPWSLLFLATLAPPLRLNVGFSDKHRSAILVPMAFLSSKLHIAFEVGLNVRYVKRRGRFSHDRVKFDSLLDGH